MTRPLLLALAVAACRAPPPDPAADAQAIRDRHQILDRAALTAQWDSAADVYAESVIVMPPGAPAIVGRETVLGMLRGSPAIAGGAPELLEIEVRGDLAYTRARYTLVTGATTDTGKMIEIWTRGRDGRWRLARDIWSSDRAAVAPRPAGP